MTIRLTPPMRTTLEQAAKQPLRRTHTPGPGKPAWPAHPATLAALIRHDFVEHATDRDRRAHKRETWTITDQGLAALTPTPRRHVNRPVFLAAPGAGRDYVDRPASDGHDNSGDYTTNPTRRIDDLEILDPTDPKWKRNGQHRHAAAADRRAIARQLARNARAA